MNVIERAECLLDAGSSGTMNFTVIAEYRGTVDAATLQQALRRLQSDHQLLRSTLLWDGSDCVFAPTEAPVPLQRLPWPGGTDPADAAQAWRPLARAALRQRFAGGGDPLWRLTWVVAADAGQLLLTFHHAIADGLSAMALVQQLFQLLAADSDPDAAPAVAGWDRFTPDLHSAFACDRHGAFASNAMPERQDVGLATDFVLQELSPELSAAVLAWTRQRQLRLNATLLAAFLQALVAAGVLPPLTTAATVVNLRNLVTPALPWELMRLLRVCVETPIAVDPAAPLDGLAAELHAVLQRQLSDGEPIQALNTIAASLADDPSPQQLWQRSWREGGLITNLGRVPVQQAHGALVLARLFFVANIEPIALPEQPLVVLGALSLADRLSLTCLYLEQQGSAEQARAVLADMARRLQLAAGG